MRWALFFVVTTCCIAVVFGSTTEANTTEPPTTTISPQTACSMKANASCADCLAAGTGCYYCSASRKCGYYPYKRLIPSHDECAYFSEVYWGVCFISLQGSVIAIGVVVGTVLLAISVCCCWCCCCRKSNNSKWLRDMASMEEERRQRQERSDERRAERKARTDDIRRKYGLVRDETPYTRFDH
ncbi:pituitary tumor-transforming gene 1 protein-interacting protein-like [Haemaphysalis longicornis]